MTATTAAFLDDPVAASAAEFHAGTDYPVTSPPAGLTPGPQKQCYANAAQCAADHGYAYAEGYAYSDRAGYWVHHAWNLTAAGEAFDLTWREPGSRYVGRTHHTLALLDRAAERGTYGAMASCYVLPLCPPERFAGPVKKYLPAPD